jgi:hypothetical protein
LSSQSAWRFPDAAIVKLQVRDRLDPNRDVGHIDQSSSRGSYTLLLHDNYHRRGAHAAGVLAVRREERADVVVESVATKIWPARFGCVRLSGGRSLLTERGRTSVAVAASSSGARSSARPP